MRKLNVFSLLWKILSRSKLHQITCSSLQKHSLQICINSIIVDISNFKHCWAYLIPDICRRHCLWKLLFSCREILEVNTFYVEQRKYILILSSRVGLSCSILRWTCIWSQAWLNCCKHRIHSTYLVKHLFCKKTVCEMHRWRLFIFGFISFEKISALIWMYHFAHNLSYFLSLFFLNVISFVN